MFVESLAGFLVSVKPDDYMKLELEKGVGRLMRGQEKFSKVVSPYFLELLTELE